MNRVGQLVKWGLVVEKIEPNLIIDGTVDLTEQSFLVNEEEFSSSSSYIA